MNSVTLFSYSSLYSLFSLFIWQNSPLGIYLMLAPVCAAEHLKKNWASRIFNTHALYNEVAQINTAQVTSV